MSKHSRSGSPQRSASSAAAAAPPAGPLSTVSAAWSAAASSAARPPLDCMIAGVGRPASPRRVEQAAQVARQQGGEGGVDLGRRRALELAEGPDDLVRQRDVHPEALAQRGADRALVLGVAIAVQQADRDRLGLGARHRVDEARRGRVSGSSTPSGPVRSRAAKRRSGGVSGAGCAAHRR